MAHVWKDIRVQKCDAIDYEATCNFLVLCTRLVDLVVVRLANVTISRLTNCDTTSHTHTHTLIYTPAASFCTQHLLSQSACSRFPAVCERLAVRLRLRARRLRNRYVWLVRTWPPSPRICFVARIAARQLTFSFRQPSAAYIARWPRMCTTMRILRIPAAVRSVCLFSVHVPALNSNTHL